MNSSAITNNALVTAVMTENSKSQNPTISFARYVAKLCERSTQVSDSSQQQECTQLTTEVKYCWCSQIGATHYLHDHGQQAPAIDCSFCDGIAIVQRDYPNTGMVYACNECAVMLDDSVEHIGAPLMDKELSTEDIHSPVEEIRHAL